MKIVLQRVQHACVEISGESVGKIQRGYVLLVGLGKDDSESIFDEVIEKVLNLRLFPDERGRFHHSLLEVEGEVLLVSQFTLFADTSKGRRPDFFSALGPDKAEPLFLKLVERFEQRLPGKTASGKFGADMKVSLLNDGPVTITLEFN